MGGVVLFFSGCSLVQNEPKPSSETVVNCGASVEKNVTVTSSSSLLIKPVETREMLFASANGSHDPIALIDSLDIYPWEREALSKIYGSYNTIWGSFQREEFKKILDDDTYLSLCGENQYVEHLALVENKIQEDILYSILLLRYLNNLRGGCLEWVSSDGQVKDEKREEHIRANYLLSMLPEGVFIQKLFLPYFPKDEEFFSAVSHYKQSEKTLLESDALKIERLNVEQLKMSEKHPDYN
jgi:hypothetical protein